jgi:hypothetical protein
MFTNIYNSLISEKLTLKTFFNSLANEDSDTCDSVFYKFIQYCIEKCNPDYFNNIIAFIILYRECITSMNYNEYREIQSQNLPSYSNDFFIFLEDKEIQIDDYIKLEYVDIMRFFNAWLLKNSLTTIKLELITK